MPLIEPLILIVAIGILAAVAIMLVPKKTRQTQGWRIEDPNHIEPLFRSLMESIARSDPAAIEFAGNTTLGSSLRALSPYVAWSQGQLDALRQAVLAQIPILVAQAQAGYLNAYETLQSIQGTPLLTEQAAGLYRQISEIEDGPTEATRRPIRALFSKAMAGDDTATKAAADLCFRNDYTIRHGNIGEVLPDGVSPSDLYGLIDRYNQNAASRNLPPLQGDPFNKS